MRSAAALLLCMSASVAGPGPGSRRSAAPTTGSASRLGDPAAPRTPPRPRRAPLRRAGRAARSAPIRTRSASARTVEIDTTGGPGFGFEHFKQHDFLRNKEVVLTFDDGPWPTTTAVLKALADECVRATFFPIGKHATYYPEILKQVARRRPHHRLAHLVAPGPVARRPSTRPRPRSRRASAPWQWSLGDQADRAVLPLPGAAPSAGARHLSRRAQHRASSRPTWTRSTSRCASPSRSSTR